MTVNGKKNVILMIYLFYSYHIKLEIKNNINIFNNKKFNL